MLKEKMQFNGRWRVYQKRVLDRFDSYSKDKKMHIVAAPGSGKTTLGIELIRRIDRPVLILAPSITIREQWSDRIREAFLRNPEEGDSLISQNLRQPKPITIATYQALHSAMTRYRGELEEDEDAGSRKEEVDYQDFDVTGNFRQEGLGTLCLDECHHLRSEWWKALEEFKENFPEIFTVSLTATPPYDSSPAQWERYQKMCGEIDEEITVPELVKQKNLCPHQDYVYLNYPTDAEKKKLDIFRENSRAAREELCADPEFYEAISTHKFLKSPSGVSEQLENPAYLASLAIFLREKKDDRAGLFQKLLGAKKLEPMSAKWMETLLQGFLYDDADSYEVAEEYREELIRKLKAAGLIEKRKVCLQMNSSLEKMLISSVGKCESIKKIVRSEYASLGKKLRLLILSDYIRREYLSALGNEEKDVASLGVLPFFEQLRRDAGKENPGLRLAVLCGTVIILPAECQEPLKKLAEEPEKLSFRPAGKLTDYVEADIQGDRHCLTGMVSELFARGYFQVLIGTKSLLGEGWDSPCVNSLILASFVGSFMLSNQMRGRAIRVCREDPEKTSNIWHLVCVRPKEKLTDRYDRGESEDFETLCRRMDHFLGLHYEQDVIESGVDRLSILKGPFSPAKTGEINRKMLEMSAQRDTLRERWDRALPVRDEPEVEKESAVDEHAITGVAFYDALRSLMITVAVDILAVFLAVKLAPFLPGERTNLILLLAAGAGTLISVLSRCRKLYKVANPMSRLELFGKGIRKALLESGKMESDENRVVTENEGELSFIMLRGGSTRDKTLFARCVDEFFSPVDNQRYLLYNPKRIRKGEGYFAVPECFSRRKEDAELFAACMKPYMGTYEALYTRSEEGRKILLEGRKKAFSNLQQRCVTHDAVKSALE